MLLNVYGRRESGKNLFIHTTMKESKKKKKKESGVFPLRKTMTAQVGFTSNRFLFVDSIIGEFPTKLGGRRNSAKTLFKHTNNEGTINESQRSVTSP